MTDEIKQRVLEILDYWKSIEFLGQIDIQTESAQNRKLIDKIKAGEDVSKKNKIELFTELDSVKDLEKHINGDDEIFEEFPSVGAEVYFCMGSIERNMLVSYLQTVSPHELVEQPYSPSERIAWYSFKTDRFGVYVPRSFRLSPLLWSIRKWNSCNEKHSFYINTLEYDKLTEEYDEKFKEKTTGDFLNTLHNEIYNTYVKNIFHDVSVSPMGFMEYNRYRDEEALSRDKMPADYSDLGRSYIINDIVVLRELIDNNAFGDGSLYEQKVIEYILSSYNSSRGAAVPQRTVISPDEPAEKMHGFFSDILNVKNAPIGKWPAKFMPALMQQVAVNIAVSKNDSAPVFSVNGPPGTGKTTLLKEVIASNVVERAILIANAAEKDPDDAFEKHFFTHGPLSDCHNAYLKFAPAYFKLKDDRINDYGILVTSCNNAAVENITADLPKFKDILDALSTSEKDPEPEDIKQGLEEVKALYDVEQSDDIEVITGINYDTKTKEEITYRDVFFTRYADKLFDPNICWGMISAPLGKFSNISSYCFHVLKRFINDYKLNTVRDEHKKRYTNQRKLFLDQFKKVQDLKNELIAVCADPSSAQNYTQGKKTLTPLDDTFMSKYVSSDMEESTLAQVANPWFTAEYNREREKLFFYACKLHKEFTAGSSAVMQNIKNMLLAWNMSNETDTFMDTRDKLEAFPVLFQTLFLLTPVISTTFASAQTFLSNIKKSGMLGTLIVDEAGQAPPQMAVGALFRCRKAIIVGDPKQIEPVVTAETDIFKQLISTPVLESYKDKHLSVQGFADYINPYGTFLGEGDEKEWVGCPLVVHRRCIDPMYSISNILSYDGTMKQQTDAPKAKREKTFIFDRSCWINTHGTENGNKDHFVKAQGEIVIKMLQKKFENDSSTLPALFIITPFTSVKRGITSMIKKSEWYKNEERAKKWLEGKSIGTVHTFQGQGTDEVIFLLGCDRTSVSAANWVSKNIVNVAATRAKFRFYVVGDKDVWTCAPVATARKITNSEINAKDFLDLLYPPDPTLLDDETDNTICPECGSPLVERSSKYGKFLGCSKFPKCRYTQDI
ncbi:MAG: topoisomerase DNA-binding C4 zinc finger domain-containing protein [Oscillospiraceae bacterium]|nr:topoisomerase DNA-binding C4 zinc finger domain-containing protein [Oscillospiraceae bacterium]